VGVLGDTIAGEIADLHRAALILVILLTKKKKADRVRHLLLERGGMSTFHIDGGQYHAREDF
jgi:hypothetical protein